MSNQQSQEILKQFEELYNRFYKGEELSQDDLTFLDKHPELKAIITAQQNETKKAKTDNDFKPIPDAPIDPNVLRKYTALPSIADESFAKENKLVFRAGIGTCALPSGTELLTRDKTGKKNKPKIGAWIAKANNGPATTEDTTSLIYLIRTKETDFACIDGDDVPVEGRNKIINDMLAHNKLNRIDDLVELATDCVEGKISHTDLKEKSKEFKGYWVIPALDSDGNPLPTKFHIIFRASDKIADLIKTTVPLKLDDDGNKFGGELIKTGLVFGPSSNNKTKENPFEAIPLVDKNDVSHPFYSPLSYILPDALKLEHEAYWCEILSRKKTFDNKNRDEARLVATDESDIIQEYYKRPFLRRSRFSGDTLLTLQTQFEKDKPANYDSMTPAQKSNYCRSFYGLTSDAVKRKPGRPKKEDNVGSSNYTFKDVIDWFTFNEICSNIFIGDIPNDGTASGAVTTLFLKCVRKLQSDPSIHPSLGEFFIDYLNDSMPYPLEPKALYNHKHDLISERFEDDEEGPKDELRNFYDANYKENRKYLGRVVYNEHTGMEYELMLDENGEYFIIDNNRNKPTLVGKDTEKAIRKLYAIARVPLFAIVPKPGANLERTISTVFDMRKDFGIISKDRDRNVFNTAQRTKYVKILQTKKKDLHELRQHDEQKSLVIKRFIRNVIQDNAKCASINGVTRIVLKEEVEYWKTQTKDENELAKLDRLKFESEGQFDYLCKYLIAKSTVGVSEAIFVLDGIQGAGKTLLTEIMTTGIFGSKTTLVGKRANVSGDFQEYLRYYHINISEGFENLSKKELSEFMSTLKSDTGSREKHINRKHIAELVELDIDNTYWLTSNVPVPVENNDRRVCYLCCAGWPLTKITEYEELEFEDENGPLEGFKAIKPFMVSCLEDFCIDIVRNTDMSKFNPGIVLSTKYHKKAQLLSADPIKELATIINTKSPTLADDEADDDKLTRIVDYICRGDFTDVNKLYEHRRRFIDDRLPLDIICVMIETGPGQGSKFNNNVDSVKRNLNKYNVTMRAKGRDFAVIVPGWSDKIETYFKETKATGTALSDAVEDHSNSGPNNITGLDGKPPEDEV